MADVKVKDSDYKKLIKQLEDISKDFQRINTKLNSRLPEKIKKILELNTPKDTGDTARAWRVKKQSTNGFSIENGRGGIIEFLIKGVEPHTIQAKNVSVLRIKLPGSILFAKIVNHPGYEPQMNSNKIFNEIMRVVDKEANNIVTQIINKNFKE